MTVEYYYKYLKDYLTRKNDFRRAFDGFLRERAEHAVHMFEAAKKAGSSMPEEVALDALLFALDDEEESKEPRSVKSHKKEQNVPFLISETGMK